MVRRVPDIVGRYGGSRRENKPAVRPKAPLPEIPRTLNPETYGKVPGIDPRAIEELLKKNPAPPPPPQHVLPRERPVGPVLNPDMEPGLDRGWYPPGPYWGLDPTAQGPAIQYPGNHDLKYLEASADPAAIGAVIRALATR